MYSKIHIQQLSGREILPYLRSLARLRVEVFRQSFCNEFREFDQEYAYLKKHVEAKESIAILVFSNTTLVGASTGLPLDTEDEKIQKPLKEQGYDPSRIFYLTESVLLKEFRGRGITHHFYEMRERHAKQKKRFSLICLTYPEKISEDFPSLLHFWRKRGYVHHPDLYLVSSHKGKGMKKTYWIKSVQGEDPLRRNESKKS